MSDVNANIDINIDASQALAEIKRLQREISLFNTSVNKGNAAAATSLQNYQRGLLNAINATGNFNAQIKTIQTTSESFTTALEKNKLSMGQYFKYAGGASKNFSRLFKTEMNVVQKTAIERVKTLQTQYIKLGRDANGAMKAMAIRPATLDMKNYTTQAMIAAQKQQIFNQLVKQGTTNLINFGKNTQWAGRQLMVGFTVPLMYLGTAAGKVFMDMEKAAIKFRRVYGTMLTTSGETEKALEEIKQLADEFTKYGVAVVDTMEMAAKAAAMGKTGAELTAQVAEATRLAVLGAVEQEQALDTTISLTNAFGTAAADLAKEINFLNAVENQTVVGIEDLTIAIPKAGPVVKQLGGDVRDLAFFLTAMKEGGINASEGANALKSGLASLINPTEKASEFLRGFGINITDIVERNKGDLKNTVVEFATALDKLDPLNRARAIEQLFGKFQFARLSTLFQNVIKDGSQASQVLDLAGKSVEELALLSERELGAIEDSIGTKFTASVEQLKKSLVPLGEQFLKIATPIVEFFTNLFDKFNNLSDGTKKIITTIVGVVGGLGPVLVMLLGLVMNGVGTIIKFFNTIRVGYQRLTGQAQSVGQSVNYLTQEQLEAEAVAASLNQGHARLTQTFTAERQAIEQLIATYNRAAQSARNFAAANPGAMLPGARFPLRRNSGGTVPGVGNTDTVPAILTPGEFVVNKEATQKNFGLLKAINNSGHVQKFNAGGMVMPKSTPPPVQKMNLGGMVIPGFQNIDTQMKQQEFKERVQQKLFGMGVQEKGSWTNFMTNFADVQFRRRLSKEDEVSRLIKLQADEDLKALEKAQKKVTDPKAKARIQQQIDEIKSGSGKISRNYASKLLRPLKLQYQYGPRIQDSIMFYGGDIKAAPSTVNPLTGEITRGKVPTGDLQSIKEKIQRFNTSNRDNPNAARTIATSLLGFTDKQSRGVYHSEGSKAKTMLNALDKALDSAFRVKRVEETNVGKFLTSRAGEIYTKGTVLYDEDAHIYNKLKSLGVTDRDYNKDFIGVAKDAKKLDRFTLAASHVSPVLTRAIPDLKNWGLQNLVVDKQFVNNYLQSLSGNLNKKIGINTYEEILKMNPKAFEGNFGIPASEAKRYQKSIKKIALGVHPTTLDDAKALRLLSDLDSKFGPPDRKVRALATREAMDYRISRNFYGDRKGRGKQVITYSQMRNKILKDMNKEIAQLKEIKNPSEQQIKSLKDLEKAKKNLLSLRFDEIQKPTPTGIAKFRNFEVPPPSQQAKNFVSAWMGRRFKGFGFNRGGLVPESNKSGIIGNAGQPLPAETKVVGGGPNDTRLIAVSPDEILFNRKDSQTIRKNARKNGISVSSPLEMLGQTYPKAVPGFQNINNPMPQSDLDLVKGGRLRYEAKQLTNMKLYGGINPEDRFDDEKRALRTQRRLRESQEKAIRVQNAQMKAQTQSTQEIDKNTKQTKTQSGRMDAMSGKLGMASGALMGLGMGAMMMGDKLGPAGETIGQVAMGASVITGLLPLLANPWVAAIAAVAALGIGVMMLKGTLDAASEEGRNLAKSMGTSADELDKMGQMTGKVSATAIRERQRDTFVANEPARTRKFGMTFLESEAGAALLQDIQTQMENGQFATPEIGKNIANQLSYAVAQGILNTDQANSIASALGEKLQDYSLTMEISANLTSILGPNGEKLESEPLQVMLEISKRSATEQANVFQEAVNMAGERGGWKAWSDGFGDTLSGGDAQWATFGMDFGEYEGAFRTISTMALMPIMGTLNIADWIRNSMANQREVNKFQAATIQLGLQQVAQNEGLVDSLYQQYDLKIKQAKTTKEIVKLEKERDAAIKTLNESNAQVLQDLVDQKEYLGADVFQEAINAEVNLRYKDTGAMKVIADRAQELLDAMPESEFKTTIQLAFASGEFTPQDVMELVAAAKENKEYETQFNILIKERGLSEGSMLLKLFKKGGIKAQEQTVMLEFLNKNPEKYEEFKQAMSDIINMKTEYGITINLSIKGIKSVAQAKKNLKDLNQEFGRNDLKKYIRDNKEALEQSGQLEWMQDFLDSWNEITEGSDTIQKNVLINYVASVSSGDMGLINAWAAAVGKAGEVGDSILLQGSDATISKYINEATKWLITEKGNINPPPTPPPTTPPPPSSGAKEISEADQFANDLLNRLKIVRDASINAKGGIVELLRVLGKGKDIKIFKGISQLLSGKKLTQDFIDAVSEMDKKTRERFVKIKNGIVTITEAGRAANKAIKEIALGNIEAQARQEVQDFKNRNAAFNRLISNGVKVKKAYELIEDATVAAALASEKLTQKELKRFLRTLELLDQVKEKYEDIRKINEKTAELNDRAKLPSMVLDAERIIGRELSDLEITSLFNREEIQGLLQDIIDGKSVNIPKLIEAFEQAGREAEIELKIKLSTEQGVLDVAGAGSNLANQIFGMYTQIAQSDLDLTGVTLPTEDIGNLPILQEMQGLYQEMEARTKQIAENNMRIAGIQEKINQYQAELNKKQERLQDLQDQVEMNYNRPIENLQDAIEKLRREQELKFDRPIQALQEESTRLSNDLTLIDKAAEAINEKYDKQEEALNKISEINNELIAQEKTRLGLADALTQGDISAAAQAAQDLRAQSAQFAQGQQSGMLAEARRLEIESLRSASGMTREQIEERQFQIGQEIYKLEQDRLKLQKEQEVLQDRIYEIEQQRKVVLDQIKLLEDEIKRYQEEMIDPLQKQIDAINLENTSLQYQNDLAQTQIDKLNEQLTVLGKTQEEWQNVAALIALATINSAEFLRILKETLDALALINPNGTVDLPTGTDGGTGTDTGTGGGGGGGSVALAKGGKVKYMANGGSMFKAIGSDTVPAMLSPGEFIMSRGVVDKLGTRFFDDLNSGKFNKPKFRMVDSPYDPKPFDDINVKKEVEKNSAVYNSYNINVNSNASNPDDVARAVINQIKSVDAQRIRSQRV